MKELPSDLDAMTQELARLWAGRTEPTGEMRELADRMVSGYPDHPWSWLTLAELGAADGARDKVRSAVDRAVSLAPDDEDVALYGVEELLNADCFDDAARLLDQVEQRGDLQNRRVVGRISGLRGWMRHRQGDSAGAENELRRALELFPEYEFHWRALPLALERQGRHKEASELADEGRRRFPDDPDLSELAESLRRSESNGTAGAEGYAAASGAPVVDDEPLSPIERDVARIASDHYQDTYLLRLIELAESIGGARVGVLTNGMLLTGVVASAREFAAEVDRYQRGIADIAKKPETMSDDEWQALVEQFNSQYVTAFDEALAERRAVRQELQAHGLLDMPAALERRVILATTRIALTLRDVAIEAPTESRVRNIPVVRVRINQINAWWVIS